MLLVLQCQVCGCGRVGRSGVCLYDVRASHTFKQSPNFGECFRSRVHRDGSLLQPRRRPPTPTCLIQKAFVRCGRLRKYSCTCSKKCVRTAMGDTDWLKRLAHWLCGWAKTPRHARRALLIEKLKVSSKIETAAPGNCDGPTGDIDIRCAGKRPHNCTLPESL